MGLLSKLSGARRGRRSFGSYPAGIGNFRRRSAGGFGGSSLGRMALGGLAAYGARRFIANRRSSRASAPPPVH